MKSTYTFLAALLLSLVTLPVWFRLGNIMPEWLSIVLVSWNFLVGPIVIIVAANGAREELDYEDPKGVRWKLVKMLVCTPLGCWGAIFVLTGAAAIFFSLWIIATERKAGSLKYLLAAPIYLGAIGLGGRMIYRSFVRIGPTRQEIEEQHRIRQERFGNPDWDFYAKHLGRKVPVPLKTRFPKEEADFEIDLPDGEGLWGSWSPIHPGELLPVTFAGRPMELLPFAWLEGLGPVFLLPGPNPGDEVYLTRSDEFEAEREELIPFAKSLEDLFAGKLTEP